MKRSEQNLVSIIVHLGCWLPFASLSYDFFTDHLTANPIQALEQRTGRYALTLLVLALACTPLAAITGWKALTRQRKALGNYGFVYATLHVITFFALDYAFDVGAIWRDVGHKAYIIVGALAFVLLLPLALTSATYWMRRLGKNWKRLHRLVYGVAPLVVLHFLLSVKGDLTQLRGNILLPLGYGALVGVLLVLRIPAVKRFTLRQPKAVD